MSEERLEIIVDNEDTYLDVPNVFYIHPQRLALIRTVGDNQFVSCLIKNSPIDSLGSMNFAYILRKLKVKASCEVIISQPITVMQEFDAKQVEANAKLAGFDEFEINPVEFVDKNDRKFKTLSVTFVKPEKKESDIEITITKTVVVDSKGKPVDPKGKITVEAKNTKGNQNQPKTDTNKKAK